MMGPLNSVNNHIFVCLLKRWEKLKCFDAVEKQSRLLPRLCFWVLLTFRPRFRLKTFYFAECCFVNVPSQSSHFCTVLWVFWKYKITAFYFHTFYGVLNTIILYYMQMNEAYLSAWKITICNDPNPNPNQTLALTLIYQSFIYYFIGYRQQTTSV